MKTCRSAQNFQDRKSSIKKLFVFVILLTLLLSACALQPEIIVLTATAESQLATSIPKSKLVPGNQYWTAAYDDPWSGPSSWVPLSNKPSDDWNDPAVALIDFLPDAAPVTLIGVQDAWCYVEGIGISFEFAAGVHVEGWLRCDVLLTYEPTPLPTPNLTPERPW